MQTPNLEQKNKERRNRLFGVALLILGIPIGLVSPFVGALFVILGLFWALVPKFTPLDLVHMVLHWF